MHHKGPMIDYGKLYRSAQGRLMTLVSNENAATPVPACPGWTVKDVVAHLAGALSDIQAGRLEDATSDQWTAAQVAKRRDRSLGEIAAEWHVLTQTAAWTLASEFGPLLVADAISHEFDIRGAIGNRDGREFESIRVAARFFLAALDRELRAEGLLALRLVLDGEEVVVGEGEPGGTLRTTWFEALRLLSGRRTPAQIRALAWDGDPEPWVTDLSLLGPAVADIHE